MGPCNGLSPIAPSHYLNQCWNIVNWILNAKFDENWIEYEFFRRRIFEISSAIYGGYFANLKMWKCRQRYMSSISFRPQQVKEIKTSSEEVVVAIHEGACETGSLDPRALGCFCLFVSLLSHFWLIHFCHLHLLYQPYPSSMCSLTPETANVGSSYNRGPGIGCWFSDCSNCSHWSLTLTFTQTSGSLSLYTTLLLWLLLIQLCSPGCWHLDSNYWSTRCRQSQLRFVLSPLQLHLRLLGTFVDVPVGYSTFHIDVAS